MSAEEEGKNRRESSSKQPLPLCNGLSHALVDTPSLLRNVFVFF